MSKSIDALFDHAGSSDLSFLFRDVDQQSPLSPYIGQSLHIEKNDAPARFSLTAGNFPVLNVIDGERRVGHIIISPETQIPANILNQYGVDTLPVIARNPDLNIGYRFIETPDSISVFNFAAFAKSPQADGTLFERRNKIALLQHISVVNNSLTQYGIADITSTFILTTTPDGNKISFLMGCQS